MGTVYCSFCGKDNSEVTVIVKAQVVSICDECVAICVHTIAQRKHEIEAQLTTKDTPND